MTLISLKDIGVTHAKPLFQNLSLTLSKSDRIGLVAANGRGKSTLLAAIAGLTDTTKGEITTARGLHVALVTQDVPEAWQGLSLYDTVLGGLPPDQADYESWRVDVALGDLQVPYDQWHTPMHALSGGWQRVALLARAWVTEPDVLLMDEPTNHLDLHRIGILQNWLATVARGIPFIMASHDRAFLDAVTNRTFFLRAEQSHDFALPYTPARAALDELDAAAAKRFENEQAKANQLRRQAAKLKNIGANSGSDLLLTKTKQLHDRAEKIEEAAKPAFQERSAGQIKLVNSGAHAKALVTLEPGDVTTPDGRLLFKIPPLWINPDDRIAVLGGNGTGKTRLLSQVIAALGSDHPTIRVAPSAVPGVSDQTLSQLDAFKTPMEAVTLSSDIGDQRARAQLATAGMDVDAQQKPISQLSGGQRSRLAMLLLRLGNPNFYILDEPTNHLDIEGQEALERELLAHDVTALLVSHDRAFLRCVATRFWQINGKRLEEVDSPEPFFESQL